MTIAWPLINFKAVLKTDSLYLLSGLKKLAKRTKYQCKCDTPGPESSPLSAAESKGSRRKGFHKTIKSSRWGVSVGTYYSTG